MEAISKFTEQAFQDIGPAIGVIIDNNFKNGMLPRDAMGIDSKNIEDLLRGAFLGKLSEDKQLRLEEEYAKIMAKGFEYHEKLPPLSKSKRGRQKQRIGKNLLDRFKEKQDCVLRFIYDFSVPFTTNLGERDIGCTRSNRRSPVVFKRQKAAKFSVEYVAIFQRRENKDGEYGIRLLRLSRVPRDYFQPKLSDFSIPFRLHML